MNSRTHRIRPLLFAFFVFNWIASAAGESKSDHDPAASAAVPAQLQNLQESLEQAVSAADFQRAIKIGAQGRALAHNANLVKEEEYFLYQLLHSHWLLGEFPQAIQGSEELLKLADRNDDNRSRSLATRTMGAIYKQFNDRKKAREFDEQALKYATAAKDEALKFRALNNLGVLSTEAGDLATAERYHEAVLAFEVQRGNLYLAAGSLTNLSDVAIARGNLPKALDLQKQALSMRLKTGDLRGQVRSLRMLSEVLVKLNRDDEAFARLQEAQHKAEAIGGHQLLSEVYRDLAALCERRKDLSAALAFIKLMTRERESFTGEQVQGQIAELQTRFDVAQKEQTIARMAQEKQVRELDLRARESELRAARLFRYGLAGLILLISITTLALFGKLRAERAALAETEAARKLAQTAAQFKSRIIGIMSHDIRSPVKTILEMANGLRAELVNRGIADERCDWILMEAERLTGFLEDVLNSEMLDSGQLNLRMTKVDLLQVVQEVAARQRWNAQIKRQKLEVEGEDRPPVMILGDYARLYQVALNLIANAIKYTPNSGSIKVSVESAGRYAKLQVTDDGPGIKSEDLPQLFTAYSRLAALPTGGETSHGLGLSIAKEIVGLHEGSITVETAVGHGTSFVVLIPLADLPTAT